MGMMVQAEPCPLVDLKLEPSVLLVVHELHDPLSLKKLIVHLRKEDVSIVELVIHRRHPRRTRKHRKQSRWRSIVYDFERRRL
jgi:ABC-type nitrate/sulfonate/bicarbonate transport system ATPase subunit